jgi:pyrroline-5-carboxylate reductase
MALALLVAIAPLAGQNAGDMSYELGIIGAGNMAEAIVRGVLSAKLLLAHQIIAADPAPERRELFQNELTIMATADNLAAARNCRTLFLSVKPQQMAGVLEQLGGVLQPDTVMISIAAGISSGFIEKHLGGGQPWRIIRTMPNTPMLIGEGMVAIAAGRHARPEDLHATRSLFEVCSQVMEVPEEMMDAVTAISGSGPAYFFLLAEQMVEAGIELGLTPEQAHTLAARTALGAARMLTETDDSPAELRRKVTSPGGTTQAAIETMQLRDVPGSIQAGIHRAAQRSRELGG